MLNEIAEHFTIDRSSVFRLISTLVKNEFVVQHPETKRYSLGYHILELSGAFNNFSYTENLIQPLMKRIQAATNQNTHLAVLDGSEVLFLAVEQPRDHLSLNLSVGTREPAVVTALGKALLAFMPADELKSILTKIKYKKYTNKSVGSAAELKKNLEQVRRDHLAVDNEEYRSGIVCFAAPVFDHTRKVKFSIGISGLGDLIKPNADKYGALVKQAGMDASLLLGYKHQI